MTLLLNSIRRAWFLSVGLWLGLFAATADGALVHAGGRVWSLNTNAPVRHYFPTGQASNGNTGTTWVTEPGSPNYFAGWPNGQPVLLMDLGAEATIDGLAFWNYSASNANNTSSFSLRFGTAAEGPLGVGQSIAYQPAFNPAYGGPSVQENFALAQPVTARYVEMTVTGNYHNLPPYAAGGDRVGFADIQFDVASPPAYQAPLTRERPTATASDSNPSVIISGTSSNQWYSVASGSDYFGTGGAPPVLVVDLGQEQTIDGFDFWNYSIMGNRTKDFSLRFAREAEGPGGMGASTAYNPSFAAANLPQSDKQSFDFTQAVTARYVEMTITSNYVAAGSGGDRVGFAEVHFRDTAPQRPYLDVLRPVAATSSTAASDYYPVANLIDGNPGTTWVTANDGDYFTNRHAPILTFDMGSDAALVGLEFLNYTPWGNGTKDFALAFATEAEGPNGFGASVDYFPVFHPLADSSTVQSFSFDRRVDARYVQMLVLDNYAGWGYAGGDRVGFAEIAFLAIPEPSTLPMAAIAMLLIAWRRRRR